jgi:hypothetical protein
MTMTTQEAQILPVGALLKQTRVKPEPDFLLVTKRWANGEVSAMVVPKLPLPLSLLALGHRLPLRAIGHWRLTVEDMERGYVKRIA